MVILNTKLCLSYLIPQYFEEMYNYGNVCVETCRFHNFVEILCLHDVLYMIYFS